MSETAGRARRSTATVAKDDSPKGGGRLRSREERVELEGSQAQMLRILALEAEVKRMNQMLGLLAKWVKRAVKTSVAANQPTANLETLSEQPLSDAALLKSPEAQVHRYAWVQRGEIIPGAQLASVWGLTRQAIGAAVSRGELFAVRVNHRLYYPYAFLQIERHQVAQVCRALGTMSDSEKFVFWSRRHGALTGKPVLAALKAGVPLKRVIQLAGAWARERGVESGGAEAT